jgi:RhoGAP domain
LTGLDEEGLYRISGVSMEVNELRDAFEKSKPSTVFTIDFINKNRWFSTTNLI